MSTTAIIAGFLVGGGFAISGGLVCTVALIRSNFGLLCLGHLFLGAALACYQYFRFAAAEIVSEKWQPVAISLMLTSGLVAAFAGPQLFIFFKDLIAATPLAGAYLAISMVSIIGLCPLFFLQMDAPTVQESGSRTTPATALAILRRRPVLSAVIAGVIVASYSWTILCMAAIPVVLLALFSLLMNRSVKLI